MGPLTAAQKEAVRDLVRLRVKPEYTAEAYGLPGLPAALPARPRGDLQGCGGWLGDGRLLPSEAAPARSQLCACGSGSICRSGWNTE